MDNPMVECLIYNYWQHMRKLITGLLLIGLLGCDKSNTFQIEFEQKVGIVKDFELNSDKKVIATIKLDKPLNIPDNSTFILTYDFLGTARLIIEPADNDRTMDFKTIQKGQTRKFQLDSTTIEITKEKYDSLLKYDSAFRADERAADSIVKAIFPVKVDKKKPADK
jgi:hypothetical protein